MSRTYLLYPLKWRRQEDRNVFLATLARKYISICWSSIGSKRLYRGTLLKNICVLNCLLTMLVCLPILLRTFHSYTIMYSCCCMVVVLFSCSSRVWIILEMFRMGCNNCNYWKNFWTIIVSPFFHYRPTLLLRTEHYCWRIQNYPV